jgi:signal transduction histidine kinase/CheY-like chemotaxis protein
MLNRITARIFRGRHALGLQSRFMLYFGFTVFMLMTAVVLLVEQRMSGTLMQQTRMRGVAISNSIAATVKSELLSYDYVSLQQAAETATEDEGLLYVIILNKEGVVAGYSGKPEQQGQVLVDPVSVAVATAGGSLVQEIDARRDPDATEARLDIAVPVHVEGTPVQWGTVRVGLSLAPLRETLVATRLMLLVLGLTAVLVVLVAARFLSRQITQPLEGLAQAISSIATGDLDQAVDENLVGELGDLAQNFNSMTEQLKRHRDAIRYQNQHLENIVQLRTAALAEKARELELVNAELKELDRLKGDFLSNVSHELRTPLTSIRSFTEIMLDPEQELSSEERHEFLSIVAGQAERLTRLISDLLDLSKIEAGEFHCQLAPMDIARVADSCLHTLRGLAYDKNVQLHNEIATGLPLVQGDVDRLNQVLTNLVDNALKFTPPRGRVTISARHSLRRRPVIGIEEPGQLPAGAFSGMECTDPEHGEYLIISVRDTGIGIRSEDQQRIFDKFGQVGNVLTDKPQGTGLGLAISGSIAMQHGGALWVESAPDVGSLFSVSIPLAHQSADPTIGVPEPQSTGAQNDVRPAPAWDVEHATGSEVGNRRDLVAALQRSAPGKQILIVDDEPSIVAALTELLQPLGYRAIGCQSGSQAVARARELRPDAIILDIMMPEINGYDVLRLLKSDTKTATIPVIVLSVLDDKQKAFALGADEYVRKPFQNEELLENVRALA